MPFKSSFPVALTNKNAASRNKKPTSTENID
jgi:hypothetical protein